MYFMSAVHFGDFVLKYSLGVFENPLKATFRDVERNQMLCLLLFIFLKVLWLVLSS